MQSTRFTALIAHQRATWSRRTTLTLLGGLPGLFLAAGSDDTTAKKRKKKQRKRRRRKDRRPDCDVCASGCAFDSVQAAIDAAAPGATIRLCAGGFAGQLDISKDLTLIGVGDGEDGTILDGRDVITTLVGIRDANVSLERLRITGAAGAFGGGISSLRSTLTLTACTVSGNNGAAGGGIFAEDGDLTLRDCLVTDNAVGLHGGGIFFDGGSLILVDSRVEDNTAGNGSGGGIYRESGAVTLERSVVARNTPDNCVGIGGCG